MMVLVRITDLLKARSKGKGISGQTSGCNRSHIRSSTASLVPHGISLPSLAKGYSGLGCNHNVHPIGSVLCPVPIDCS
jgi:hypothetical protein